MIKKKLKKSEIYEKDSILVSDESSIISGLLVGLNALDISIDLKSDANNLDQPVIFNISPLGFFYFMPFFSKLD